MEDFTDDDWNPNEMMMNDSASVVSDLSGATSPGMQTPNSKRRRENETSEILHEFLANRPKPSDFIPQQSADDIQQFFKSMEATVRKLSPLAIARIKLKIANIVGEEEIAWAEKIN